MCGRYYVDDDMAREIEKLVREVDERLRKERMGRDVYPTNIAPVLTGNTGGISAGWQRWGYPGFQKHKVIFNARSETVLEKRMFSDGIRRHRVIIPGAWFYEWNKNKEKITFSRPDSPVLFMAGFSGRFEEEERFVILTTGANQSMISTHDRMPLILEKNQIADWILNDSATKQLLEQKPILLDKRAEYEQQSLFLD